MAATATRTLKNFVNGEYVEPPTAAYSDVVNPADGEVYAQAPLSSAERRRRRHGGGRAPPSRTGATATPAERSSRCSASPTRSRRGRTSSSRRGREHRQAARADGLGGDPADGRPDPLLRRRRARARGPLGRRVHARHDVVRPARADRRRRPGHALELPDDDGDLEDRPGARRGQHHRAQAARHDARLDAADGRDRRGVLPAGRLQRDLRRPRHRPRAGRRTRRRNGRRSPARCAPAWRWRARRPPTSSASTSSSAARRRWSSSTTPTSRPRPRRSPSAATSTPARTARRRPG